jgi:hypothetical protein
MMVKAARNLDFIGKAPSGGSGRNYGHEMRTDGNTGHRQWMTMPGMDWSG